MRDKKECKHRRIKKNYPFGRKSTSTKFCKDCGALISNKMLEQRKKERRKGGRRNGEE